MVRKYWIFLLGACFVISIKCSTKGNKPIANKIDQISYPEFYRQYNEIESIIDRNKSKEAIVKFDSLTQYVPFVPSYCYFRMYNAVNPNCELAAKYLKLALVNGYEFAAGNKEIMHNCSEIIKTIAQQESTIHASTFNFKYKSAIDSMFIQDQKYRALSDSAKCKSVDSSNMELLLDLINTYGYPSEKIIGSKSAFDAFIILLHMDSDKDNVVFGSIINEAFGKGYIGSKGFSWITDRRRSVENQDPYYYHFVTQGYDKLSSTQKDEINRRRDSIGLSKL
jgi:hypothetical protein